MAAIAALVARFKANKILPLQPEFIGFFVELPEDAWLALRQAMIDAKIPNSRHRQGRCGRSACSGQGRGQGLATLSLLRARLRAQGRGRQLTRPCATPCFSHENPGGRGLGARQRRAHASPHLRQRQSRERPLPLDDFVAHMPTQKFIFKPTGDLWPRRQRRCARPAVRGGGSGRQSDLRRCRRAAAGAAERLARQTCARRADDVGAGRASDRQRQAAAGERLDRQRRSRLRSISISRRRLCRQALTRPRRGRGSTIVRKIYPDEADHIIGFFAHRVQRPQRRSTTGSSSAGAPGIGKDTLLEPVRRAVGPWNFQRSRLSS